MTPGLAQFKLSFELSPIILTGGIAANVQGGAIPIISLTESQAFDAGLLSSGADDLDLDDFFANFIPLPQATLIDQSIGTYPFANQAVAANSVIANPLAVSFRMICPVKRAGGYAEKLAIMSSLQATLQKHNASGGTYVLATPSAYYPSCLMIAMRDVSSGDSAQVQTDWQLDFVKPLLTLADAGQAQNSLMSKLSSGTQLSGDPPAWSGLDSTVGNDQSLAGPPLFPPLHDLGGGGVVGI